MRNVSLTGTIFKDMKYYEGVGNKKSMMQITVSTRNNFKGQDGKFGYTYVSCRTWGHQADFINKYFKEGTAVEIQGTLEQSSWSKESGEKMYDWYVKIDSIGFGVKDFVKGNIQPEYNNSHEVGVISKEQESSITDDLDEYMKRQGNTR
ncbi:single-stranded DNA-binding protein [Erysipelothrix aquatica]|uniref:single-stranded DNA-binding protein n=1 Tax=Erysipelothrix aquatica TaxID=2683714 RepID=UPI00135B1C13|nr:single-stranded DNA-binding protein [Erysipelothrix aquatica]